MSHTNYDGDRVNIKRLGHRNAKAVVAGDFALSAGWGSTASVAVTTGSTDAYGEITVTSAGTGQGASPTVTLTFADGAWRAADGASVTPIGTAKASGGTGTMAHVTTSCTGTTLVITWVATPVAASTYKIVYDVRG